MSGEMTILGACSRTQLIAHWKLYSTDREIECLVHGSISGTYHRDASNQLALQNQACKPAYAWELPYWLPENRPLSDAICSMSITTDCRAGVLEDVGKQAYKYI